MPPRPRSARTPRPDLLDDATRELIRRKVRQLTGRSGFSPADADDLEQDIAAHLLPRLVRFDPAKADRARFVRLLLAHAASTVLRDRRRHKRRARPSLDALVCRRGDQAVELVDALTSTAADDRARELDVAAVLAALPPKLRRVAEALKTRSVTAAARRLRLSRAAVYRRLAELRAAFVAAGLEQLHTGARTLRARRG